MPGLKFSSRSKINLENATVMLVDDNVHSLDILASILLGFGGSRQVRCTSADEAIELTLQQPIDLFIVDCEMPGTNGFEFVSWLRRIQFSGNEAAPVIMVTGHASEARVQAARDHGADFLIAKPVLPLTLLKRLYWIAHEPRDFITCDAYVGPDRRRRNLGPPIGMKGRRQGDLSADVGLAKEPNMSQDQIDLLVKPMRAKL